MLPDSRRSLIRGPVAVAAFGGAVELRQADHRNVQLAGDRFDRARDFADLLLPVFRAGIVHELHVVDHDALDVVLQLQPPGLGPQFQRRQARRIVHPDRRLGQLADDVGQLACIPGC